MQQAIQSIMTIEDPQVRNEALQKLKPVQDFLDGNRPFSSQSTGTIHSLFSKRLIEITSILVNTSTHSLYCNHIMVGLPNNHI